MIKLMCFCLLLIIGCSQSAIVVDIEKEKEAIIKHSESWAQFTTADEYFNHITDDFIYLGPDMEALSDLDSMYRWIENICKNTDFSFVDWVTDEILIIDTIAIHRYTGTAIFTSKMDSTKSSQQFRKYIDIYRKTEKGWLASRHMWNRNN